MSDIGNSRHCRCQASREWSSLIAKVKFNSKTQKMDPLDSDWWGDYAGRAIIDIFDKLTEIFCQTWVFNCKQTTERVIKKEMKKLERHVYFAFED